MLRLLAALYSLFYTLLVAGYLPFYLYRILFRGKRGVDLLQRAGRLPSEWRGSFLAPGALWIHAVSVGEVNALKPLVEALKLEPDRLLISTTTETGQALARELFASRGRTFYFPLDWSFATRRYLKRLRPGAVLLMETELWPRFILSASSLKIPVLLINGRISDRSFPRYRRARFFLRPLLRRVERFCMQSRQDRERILELGAPPDRVNRVGNLKFDYELPENPEKTRLVEWFRSRLKEDGPRLVWICGSTREGEEGPLLRVFQQLREDFPDLRLVLAPRHPHRGDEVAALVETLGLSGVRRSRLNLNGPAPPGAPVVVLDTIGELVYLYELADAIFIGGSLVPWGGHNPIEAAYFGKPILFGPHMHNFREISQAFVRSYAALQVRNGDELASRLRELLRDPAARNWLGRNARKVVRDNQGAVHRTLEIVRPYLERV